MDEAKNAEEIDRGHRANALLQNAMFREAFGKVRQGIHDRWAASPIRDVEGQTSLRMMLKLLDDVEGNIKSVAMTGKLAEQQRQHEWTLREQAKRVAEGFMRTLGK